MKKRLNSIKLSQREMDIATAKSEFKRIQAFILALLIGLIIMVINFFVFRENADFFNRGSSKYVVVGWFLIFLLYELVGFLMAKKYLRDQIILPQYLKVINVSIESALPGLLLFLLTTRERSVIFLDSPLMFFYFILIALAALNLEVRLALVVGLVSAGSYFFVTYWSIVHFDAQHEVLHFPPALYYARSFFMMLAALGSVFVTREIKNRYESMFNLKKERDDIERLFDQQVSKEVADTLIVDNFFSKRGRVSILFLDIRNYSNFAEERSPEEVIEFQNKFFNPILRIINLHQGIVNQIMGDGLMASFGAPIPDERHAQKAYETGLSILDKVAEQVCKLEILPTKIGIGIHTGDVVMGNIGNELRKQFSLSGTTVVLAARIEQANKKYNSEFLISKNTFDEIEVDNGSIIPIGKIKMKNITKEIDVYKVK